MAQETRSTAAEKLLSLLETRASQVSFFQALMALERLFAPDALLGHEGPPRDEPIRIRPSISLSVPPTDVESISVLADRKHAVLTATFLGLYGVDSPLAPQFAEHLARISTEPEGKRIRAFLDIFHHRLYSLLFRTWKKARPLSGPTGELDPLYDRVLSMVGYASRLGIGGPARPKLAGARLRVLRARTATGLRAFVKLGLGLECTIGQLRLRLAPLAVDQRSALGAANSSLGLDTVAGTRVADRNKIGLKMEATDLQMWISLAPEGALRRDLQHIIDDYLADPIDRDLDLQMNAEHVPPAQLGSKYCRIGRTLWLGPPTPQAKWQWTLTQEF